MTAQSNTLDEPSENMHRMTFGRNKISSNVKESLKEKRYFLDENTPTGKSLLNPIKKLEKIKNNQN